ncbi:site-specific DNA-methyltransferase [Massiliimalia timonensis]|uniref:site-specific DNA-methyltransferase n=1 Tax=Massiliimalia timonensis TaxID=1987501 RepID=UPI000B8B3A73|nr:site-specific DNA-methyltransferase [Massiliimalia timonensis]
MDKLKMQTANKADENFKKLAELFPNAVTETIDENGEVVRAIDKDVLMQEINTRVVDGNEERYQFTWPDKKKSVLLANAPINKTLRPCREESVDFDNTENLYIEGDNLEVLKLLQETYLGKIKMIYIDPPYNTGNDFVYEDDFAQSTEEYLANSGQFDDEGNRLVKNLDSNGRFHTDWLNMIYPRLKLAKDLLSDDGVIFISIDDNEVDNLRKVCTEVFGASNFVGCFLWRKKSTSTNVANALVSPQTDYQLCYAKKLSPASLNRRITTTEDRTYPYTDEFGKYRTAIIEKKDSGTYTRSTMKFPILGQLPREGKRWQIGEKTARDYEAKNLFVIDNGIIKLKIYEKDDKATFSANPTLLLDCGSSDSAAKETNIGLFNQSELFTNPKPTELLKHLIKISTSQNAYILDFFSGSATTAHAVMQLNAEDSANRKFIMVQVPEKTDEKSEAYKAGYQNICEIGKERIRRAGAKIKDESPLTTQNLDTGFRVLKCDSSNMKDVYYNPSEYNQSLFASLEDNIKEDRTPEDLLFQVMLDLGVLLSSKIEETVIDGKKVFDVADGFLIACFDENVTDETITAIAKQKPYYFVMRDSSMANDSVATNFEQIFATYSPDTVRKVL